MKQSLIKKLGGFLVVFAALTGSQVSHASLPFDTVTVGYEEAARERDLVRRLVGLDQAVDRQRFRHDFEHSFRGRPDCRGG